MMTRESKVGRFEISFFRIFEIIFFFCFDVAICDLVYDVEAINDLCNLLTGSGSLFMKYV